MKTLIVVVLALAVVGMNTSTRADAQSDALASIDAAMPDAVQKQGFGGYILIEVHGKPVFSKGYGYADREKKVPFRIDTIAQIGSITKAFTAFAILNLAHEGKI